MYCQYALLACHICASPGLFSGSTSGNCRWLAAHQRGVDGTGWQPWGERACSVASDSLQPMDCNVVLQASLSMGFSRREYWSGFPCPPAEDLPDRGLKLPSPCISCIAGRFFTHRAAVIDIQHY